MLMGPKSTAARAGAVRRPDRADPRNYIAQPVIEPVDDPDTRGGGSEPRHLDLRPFILSGRAVQVTTGGLTRVAMRKGSLVVNSSQGGGSKDTWIVDAPADMLSRVADNLYWLARYLERTENLARLLDVSAGLMLDLPQRLSPGWRPLIKITGNEAGYIAKAKDFGEKSVVRFIVADEENPARC